MKARNSSIDSGIDGSIVAIVTPFNQDKIDTNSLQDLVAWHVQQGTDAIVVIGSTGEAALLSKNEHAQAIQAALNGRNKSVNPSMKIIAGVGSASTAEAVSMAKTAQDLGVDAIMIVTPCYVKPGQAGALRHFYTIAQNCSLPIILYNNPGRTGTNLTKDTLVEACKTIPNIVGIKDSSNNLEMISLLRQELPARISLLSGDDSTNIGFLAQGGNGIISVTANVFPKLCKEFVQAWKDGDKDKAFLLHQRLMPVHKAMFCEPNPCPAKYALSIFRKIQNEVRLPLSPVIEGSPSAKLIRNAIETVLSASGSAADGYSQVNS